MSASERKATLDRARLAGENACLKGLAINNNPYKATASRIAWETGWRMADDPASSTMQASTVQASTVQIIRDSRRARSLKQSTSILAIIANQRTRFNQIAVEEERIAVEEERIAEDARRLKAIADEDFEFQKGADANGA